MNRLMRSLMLSVATGTLIVLLGCGKSEAPKNGPPSGNPVPGPGSGAPAASGNAVYDQYCAKCHPLGGGEHGGFPGKKGGNAPSLAKVAADPAHTAEWLADHIKNPKGHKPDSKMPPFEGKLSSEQLKSVTDFLSKQK